jgi:hypothetical protein
LDPPLVLNCREESPLTCGAVEATGVTCGAAGAIEALAALEEDVPAEFVAIAVKVYEVPLVSGEITQDVAGDVTVHVAPPGAAVTV